MKYTDLDRIVEQIEEIPWSDNYIWRFKWDFINFVRKFESREIELEAEINELSEDCESNDRIIQDLQDDIELANEDYLELDKELEELKEELEELKEENLKLNNNGMEINS